MTAGAPSPRDAPSSTRRRMRACAPRRLRRARPAGGAAPAVPGGAGVLRAALLDAGRARLARRRDGPRPFDDRPPRVARAEQGGLFRPGAAPRRRLGRWRSICVSEMTARRLRALYRTPGRRPRRAARHRSRRLHPRRAGTGRRCGRAWRLGVAGQLRAAPRDDRAPQERAGPRRGLRLPGGRRPRGSGSCSPGHRVGGRGELEDAIGAVRHRDRVVRLGYVDASPVPALLRRAAAVAYPSFYEGFGLPALEALACGAPLVTSRGTVMAELAGPAGAHRRPGGPGRARRRPL